MIEGGRSESMRCHILEGIRRNARCIDFHRNTRFYPYVSGQPELSGVIASNDSAVDVCSEYVRYMALIWPSRLLMENRIMEFLVSLDLYECKTMQQIR